MQGHQGYLLVLARAAKFYDAVLATIGLRRTRERDGVVGYGVEERLPPEFWIHGACFSEAALREGGADAGAPGPRPQYTAGYYGAFAFDLDGFKIEAVVREALPPA